MTETITPLNPYAAMANLLAEEIYDVLSNDRAAYEALTGGLARQYAGTDPERYGEVVKELLVRLFRRSGVDPDRCSTLLDTLLARVLGLVDWRDVGEGFVRVAAEAPNR